MSIRPIKKGEIFTLENLDIKRPGCGIEPKYLEQIIGKCARKDIEDDKVLVWGDVSS